MALHAGNTQRKLGQPALECDSVKLQFSVTLREQCKEPTRPSDWSSRKSDRFNVIFTFSPPKQQFNTILVKKWVYLVRSSLFDLYISVCARFGHGFFMWLRALNHWRKNQSLNGGLIQSFSVY